MSAWVPGAPVDLWGPCSLLYTHTEQRGGGPRPHCLSNNWDVKPFTVSSGEASKLKNLKNRKQKKERKEGRGGDSKQKTLTKYMRDSGAKRRGKHNPNFEDRNIFLFCITDKTKYRSAVGELQPEMFHLVWVHEILALLISGFVSSTIRGLSRLPWRDKILHYRPSLVTERIVCKEAGM